LRARCRARPGAARHARLLVPVLLLLAAGPPGPRPARAAAEAPALGRRAMVVTSQADATRAGVEMLRAGGNAVDAAVAAAFALAVTQPQSTGLGGGGFLLVRGADGGVEAIDARETAPAASTPDMYVREGVPERASLRGALASGTPGMVAGLALVQARHGRLSLAEVLAPAIRLAREGYAIGPHQAALLRRLRDAGLPERFPATAAIHLPPEGEPVEPGFVVVQSDLARVLEAIAEKGPQVFYRGWVAEAIVRETERRGGILDAEDLATYRPVVREPVRGTYRGFEVVSFPPPSSGGVALIQSLNILEGFDLAAHGAGSSAAIHRIAEGLKLAFADRSTWLGDPDFVDVPVGWLTSERYADELRARINPPRWRRWPWTWHRDEVAIEVEAAGRPPRDAGTTHLSVVDEQGAAVAATLTINTAYGSWLTIPGTGIVMNNEMDDFSKQAGVPNVYGLVDTRGANAIAPGKRPLSSMTPTLLVRDGGLALVTGSPGGPRIISTVLQSILNVVDFGMDVQAAVAAPRVHHQWIPDLLYVEREVPTDVVEGLRDRGHEVKRGGHWSAAEAIRIDPERGWRWGGSDPRRDGLALGF